ncbi:LysR substrate-binding domain-containing protein, partial [Halomonas sp. BM-2019]|uniref:LysR substrate-binding domain-containing protein n=1 Tax=Halomonas sp. BM-2019 TaxID=2811227 RepID=UPI0031FCF0EB
LALQPTVLSGDTLRQGRLRVVLAEHEPEPLGLYAVYAHRQLLASKVRHFVDFLEGYFGDPPYWDRL